MNNLLIRLRSIILLIVPIFIALNVLLIDVYNIDNQVLNLVIYAITYMLIVFEIFLINDCEIISGPVLAALLFSLSIGLGPIAYYLFLGRTCEAQYSIILFALFSFLIGDIFYKIKIKKYKKEKKIDRKIKEKNYKLLEIILWGMLMISIVASIYYIYTNRNVFQVGGYENGRISAMSGNGVIIQAIGLGVIALYIMFELVLENKVSKRKFITFALLVIPTTIVKGFRGEIIAPIMILMIMYNRKHKIKMKKIIIILAVGVLTIFLLGIMRQSASNESMKWYNSFLLMFANGSINLNAVFNTFPEKVEFQKGYTYLINLLMLLPGEDLDFTLWLKDKVGYSFSGGGMTPTIIGEIYINFGIILVPVFLFALGIIVNMIEEVNKNSSKLFYSSYGLYTIAGVVGSGICVSEVTFLITTVVYIAIYILSRLKLH